MEDSIKVKEQGVHIRLKSNWMGTPSGARMHVWEHVAKELYERGACEILDERVKEDFDNGDLIEEKQIEEPTKNKMVKRPSKSK